MAIFINTNEEINNAIEKINNMTQYEMCSIWRFTRGENIYFDNTYPVAEIFKKRLFEYFGGFTPEISKDLGF